MKLIEDLYQYRELLKSNVKKEIRGKYKGSFLGVLWSFVSPLLSVAVYAIVFPYLFRNTVDNYLQFLVVGIIPWTFFTTSINQGISTIRVNEGIIKKVYFPREILPISVVTSGLINFFISAIIMLLFCVMGGLGISWHIILFPFFAMVQYILTLGLVLGLSAINVYIKDTEYIIAFLINLLFYGTPILYDLSTFQGIPHAVLFIINLNPFRHFMDIYRDIFMYHQVPPTYSMVFVVVCAIVVFILGLLIFRKLEKGFAEEI
ncbi:MAG: ABC transporter permease [Thomasclavelia sp.]|jgi:lipopolysaccharide transport system permease protein|nr:ABC transporter permease [Thomasclavelia sp.]